MTSEPNIILRKVLAAISLILGILSLAPLAGVVLLIVTGHENLIDWLSNFLVPFAGIEVVSGIAATITGIVSLKQAGERNNAAVAGTALGTLAVGSILLITWIILNALSHLSIA